MEPIKISLASARVNAGYRQEDVAKMLKVSKQTVVNWEKGKTIPSFSTLNTLSSIYDIPIDNIRIFLPKEST